MYQVSKVKVCIGRNRPCQRNEIVLILIIQLLREIVFKFPNKRQKNRCLRCILASGNSRVMRFSKEQQDVVRSRVVLLRTINKRLMYPMGAWVCHGSAASDLRCCEIVYREVENIQSSRKSRSSPQQVQLLTQPAGGGWRLGFCGGRGVIFAHNTQNAS